MGLFEVQKSLFETMRLLLIARLENHTPQIAAEFGRQGIPALLKPSLTELEVFLKDLSRDFEGISKTYQDVEAALDNFYNSLETDK